MSVSLLVALACFRHGRMGRKDFVHVPGGDWLFAK